MQTLYSERLLAKFKKELAPTATELGLPHSIFERPDIEIPVETYYELLNQVAVKSNPHIGFSIGKVLNLKDLGVLGHAAMAAPNVGYAVRMLEQYVYTVAQSSIIRLDVGKDFFIMDYHLGKSVFAKQQQDIELTICMMVNAMRNIISADINPIRLDLSYPKPQYHKKLQKFFGCPIFYDKNFNQLKYPTDLLTLDIPSHDHSLLIALEFYLADKLKIRKDDEDLINRVSHLIATRLDEGAPDINTIAKKLGMTRRTLQRRLQESGHPFVNMVDKTRQNIARDYVLYSDYSQTDISLMLGYNEVSSFSRAFKRWTGISPLQMREKNQLYKVV